MTGRCYWGCCATRRWWKAPGQSALSPADEHGLAFRGLLVFLDPPKPDARAALERLAGLGVTVKILTGDNPVVAAKVCADLGLPAGQVATGADIDKARRPAR